MIEIPNCLIARKKIQPNYLARDIRYIGRNRLNNQ